MRKLLLLSLLFQPLCRSFAQPPEYATHVQQAAEFYKNKKYTKAGKAYAEAFASFGDKGFANDRYNAACAWAQAGENDSAFHHLERLATKANYTNYAHLTADADLNNLHNDKRWEELCARVKQNKDKAEANLDKHLVALLDTIYEDDQNGRGQIDYVQQTYGRNSPELNKLWDDIKRKDSIDLVKVIAIIDKYGWPGADVAGVQGSQTVFLVIQHADIKTQEHYLPMMREAVKNKKASPASLAMLEDRVALREGKKQIYGSQIHMEPNGEAWVSILEDPDNVDKRRAEVGLQPLGEYVQMWGLHWDAEAYKKALPEYERREKEQKQ